MIKKITMKDFLLGDTDIYQRKSTIGKYKFCRQQMDGFIFNVVIQDIRRSKNILYIEV